MPRARITAGDAAALVTRVSGSSVGNAVLAGDAVYPRLCRGSNVLEIQAQ